MKNIFVFLLGLCILFFNVTTKAQQEYRTAIGGRLALDGGITFKQFLGDHTAFELMATTPLLYKYNNFLNSGFNGLKAVFMLEFQNKNKIKTLFIPRFYWIYGLGLHISRYAANQYPIRGGEEKNLFYTEIVFPVGADVMLGCEYEMKKHPFTFGLDVRPFYEFYQPGPYFFDGGLSLRYTFK